MHNIVGTLLAVTTIAATSTIPNTICGIKKKFCLLLIAITILIIIVIIIGAKVVLRRYQVNEESLLTTTVETKPSYGGFARQMVYFKSSCEPLQIRTMDIDGDTQFDIIQFCDRAIEITIIDWNEDGKLDIIVPFVRENNHGEVAILLNTGNNSFMLDTTRMPVNYSNQDFAAMDAIDMNLDGKIDIIFLNSKKHSIMSSLKEYLLNLNLFKPSSESNEREDEHQKRSNIISTRVYLLILILLLLVNAVVLRYMHLTVSITISYPTKEQFDELPSDANCPCSRISIPRSKFISIEARFHHVCESDFISDRWINATFFGSNVTYLHTQDFRSFASAQFQGLASLCYLSKFSYEQGITSLNKKTFISPNVLPENALRSLIQSSIDQLKLSISSVFALQLQTIRDLTATNKLMSGLMTDTHLEYMENIYTRHIYITTVRKSYGIRSCNCYYTKGCKLPVGIYDLFWADARRSTETRTIMDIPGMVTSCYPLNSILESSLECFYDRKCVNNLLLHLPTNEKFTAMTISETSRFPFQTTVQSLVDHLMIEDWNTSISYEQYYNQCIPMTCTYSTVKPNSFLIIITKCIGTLSTLTMILKLLIPKIIQWIRRPRNVKPTPKIPFRIKFQQLKVTLCKTLMELNIFQRSINDNYHIRYRYDATRLYIVSIFISIVILATSKYFDVVMHRIIVLNPSESQYMTLQKLIQIQPRYHHICSSDIVDSRVIRSLTGILGVRSDRSPLDYLENGHIQFHFLANFCRRIQQLVDDAILDFLLDQFVSSTILSRDIFESQINLLIEYWKSTIKNQNLRNIDIIRATTHGNQLMSPLLNTNFSFTYINRQLKLVPMKYSNCSCVLSPSCRTDMGLYERSSYSFTAYKINTYIPTMFMGCYPNEALLASTLECFYNASCTLALYNYPLFEKDFNLPFLNSNISSVNMTIASIIDQLMIDSWPTVISFSDYYRECAPHSCTYQYLDRNSLLVVITTIMSIIGGLTLGFKIFFIIGLLIIENVKNKSSPIALIRLIKNQFICQHKQRIIDRLHFIFVTITLISIYISITFSPQTRFVEIHKPSFSTYEKLQKRFSSTLQCSCSHASIKYELFFNITSTFHHVCSSDFVSDRWIAYLYDNGTIFDRFIETDFRASAFAQFQLLSSFCNLSQKIVNDSLRQLIKSDFINSDLLLSEQLNEIIQSTIDELKLTIPSVLLTTLALIRETTQVNKIMTSISTSWRLKPRPRTFSDNDIYHPTPLIYQGCNCGLSSKCVQPSRGMLAGCYSLESLLQSTFLCLYDQQCIDSTANFIALNISTMKSSHFTINMTIESIVKQLFIEEYLHNITYEKYFDECAVSSCRYSYIDKMNIIDGITNLISLYGGLMILCQSMAEIVVQLCQCRQRRIGLETNSIN
ncbi:hypothetical protein I4U23_016232 [Adineta vaga]|nr:hypothetical protein I4U23_016232 [Adineta vaga]